MPAPTGGGQDESQLGILWWIGGIAVVGLIVWFQARAYLVAGYLFLKKVEILAIQFFLPVLGKAYAFVLASTPEHTSLRGLQVLGDAVGGYIKYPVAVILLLFAVALYYRGSASRYKNTYDMNKLLEAEQENWPQEGVVIGENLVKQDIDKGPWAMALPPLLFAKKNKLIDEDQLVLQAHDPKRTATAIRSRALGVFKDQLGKPWTNLRDLNPHTKALFAAFAARACRDTEASQAFLLKISISARNGKKPDFSGTYELLKKHVGSKLVGEVVGRHAYVYTIMAELLMRAREDGVLASADFLWLKPLDRRLWYMLNTVGRQTAYTEVAGPYAHWLAERKLGGRIKAPMVEKAVDALEVALKEIIYK